MHRLQGIPRLLAACSFLLVLASPAAAAEVGAGAPKVGEKAPPFEIQGFKLEELRGKKNVLLVFYRGHF